MKERIGLIAGNGQFPILLAKSAQAQGEEIVAVAVRQETSPEIEDYVERVYWIGLGELNKFFQILGQEKLKKVVMAGQIKPVHIFDKNVAQDQRLKNFLQRVKDKRADSLLGTLAKILARRGIRLLDSTTFLKSYLIRRGVLTKLEPSALQWQDINFGRGIAKRIAALDIGQTVVVKDKAILAIEAIEGTDEAITRGGALGGPGAVVVKVSKPRQDMRFDIPIVGPKTIDCLACASCAAMAIEAGKALFLEPDLSIRTAEANNICLVGI
ncbi:MAG: UDP-2,3-diacylglucosamine diphosphatase LpxI [Candidatus Omnitrophica bacterium]|nr:UDP-2,3-diacylglucosamine diphosphatase LpxI [Candidatus Omnitrophota bacterium]